MPASPGKLAFRSPLKFSGGERKVKKHTEAKYRDRVVRERYGVPGRGSPERVVLFIGGCDFGFSVEVKGGYFAEGCWSCAVVSVLFKKCIPCV